MPVVIHRRSDIPAGRHVELHRVLLGHVIVGIEKRGRSVDKGASSPNVGSKETESGVQTLNPVGHHNGLLARVRNLNRSCIEFLGRQFFAGQVDDIDVKQGFLVVE